VGEHDVAMVAVDIKSADVDAHERHAVDNDHTGNGLVFSRLRHRRVRVEPE